ncbi:MAG: hypothetical protein ABSG55_04050 [Dehalococcoidia bacterium]|jgi:hypothetical protein
MAVKTKTCLLLGVIVGAAALLGVACGGGGSDSSQSTSVPLTTCHPATPPVFGTPIVAADKQMWESADLGYSLVYPDDWHAAPGQANYQNIFGDAFFGPNVSGDVQPNIAVTCETIPVGGDTNAYADYRRAVLQQLLEASPDSAATVTVDGHDAFFWHYKITNSKTSAIVDKIEVLFADDRGGWMISLVAPEGHLGDYKPVLDDVLASFHEH